MRDAFHLRLRANALVPALAAHLSVLLATAAAGVTVTGYPPPGSRHVSVRPPVVGFTFAESGASWTQLVDHASVEAGLRIEPSVGEFRHHDWTLAPSGEHLSVYFLAPDNRFSYDTEHVVTLTGARTVAGLPLPTFSFAFKTQVDNDDVEPGPDAYRVLVLSGGGAKGDFQVGAVKYLYDVERWYPNEIIGISVGALNATLLAHARQDDPADHRIYAEELQQFWLDIASNDDIYVETPSFRDFAELLDRGGSSRIPGGAKFLLGIPLFGHLVGEVIDDRIRDSLRKINSFMRSSYFYDVQPLRQLVQSNVDLTTLRASGTGLRVGAVSLRTGEYREFTKDYGAFLEALIASTAMPVFFPPVFLEGQTYVDGGIKETAALRSALDHGGGDIVVILSSRYTGLKEPARDHLYGRSPRPWFETLLRAVTDGTYDEVLHDDIDSVLREVRWRNRYQGADIRIRIIQPEVEVHGTLGFSRRGIRRGIQHGFEMAQQTLSGVRSTRRFPDPVEHTRTARYLIVRPVTDTNRILILDRPFVPSAPSLGLACTNASTPTPGSIHFSGPWPLLTIRIVEVSRAQEQPIWTYPYSPDGPMGEDEDTTTPASIHDPTLPNAFENEPALFAFPLHATESGFPDDEHVLVPRNLRVEVTAEYRYPATSGRWGPTPGGSLGIWRGQSTTTFDAPYSVVDVTVPGFEYSCVEIQQSAVAPPNFFLQGLGVR